MNRWVLPVVIFLLVACGRGDGAHPTAPSAVPLTTALPTATVSIPAVPSAITETTPTLVAAERTAVAPTLTPLPKRTQPALFDRSVLATKVGEVTLGPPVSVCAGDGLFVAEDGTVFTLGRHGGPPCASAIDLTTGSTKTADPLAVPSPLGRELEVSDAARARVYVAEGGRVTAHGCCGLENGAVLVVPSAEPGGGTVDTALRLSEATDRLYLSYRDYDGQDWIASVDLSTGETIADVAVPPGPWDLATGRDGVRGGRPQDLVVFADTNTFLVLDGGTLEPVNRLSLSRRPAGAAVDPSGKRLFVTDVGGDLHVLDPTTLVELDWLPGVGAAVDLDPQLAQLYVGDRYSGGVHVFDLATLKPVGHIPQPGRPVASPADGRVYIVEEDVYEADGRTLQVIEGRALRKSGCEGCNYPTGIIADPQSGQVYTTTDSILSGKPGPSSQAAVDPVTGRAFIARTTGSHQPVYSLAVYPDLSLREPVRWIDGLYGQLLYNPVSDQLYLSHGGRLLVLDGQTLELLGDEDIGEDLVLLAMDEASGSLYATLGEQLLRFELRDGFADLPQPEPVQGLPGPVYGIIVSPGFAQDATLYVRATDWKGGRSDLYRSTDGGRSWVRLRGGLPGAPNDLVFGQGGQLYAAVSDIGWRSAPEAAVWGEGVYVSHDGGDTWRPDNTGLTHLRVGRLHVGDDSTLYAMAAAAVEPGHPASGPTIWARTLDEAWEPVSVPDGGLLRLVDYAIPATYTRAVQAHWHELSGDGPLYQSRGQELWRSNDGGSTWSLVGRGPTDFAEDVIVGSEGVYWLDLKALWRSTDEGVTWAALRHPDLADGPPFSVTVADVGGAETLFLGTETGQVLIVRVDEAEWGSR